MTVCLQSSKLKWAHKALHVASDCAQGGPGGRMKDARGGGGEKSAVLSWAYAFLTVFFPRQTPRSSNWVAIPFATKTLKKKKFGPTDVTGFCWTVRI